MTELAEQHDVHNGTDPGRETAMHLGTPHLPMPFGTHCYTPCPTKTGSAYKLDCSRIGNPLQNTPVATVCNDQISIQSQCDIIWMVKLIKLPPGIVASSDDDACAGITVPLDNTV